MPEWLAYLLMFATWPVGMITWPIIAWVQIVTSQVPMHEFRNPPRRKPALWRRLIGMVACAAGRHDRAVTTVSGTGIPNGVIVIVGPPEWVPRCKRCGREIG